MAVPGAGCLQASFHGICNDSGQRTMNDDDPVPRPVARFAASAAGRALIDGVLGYFSATLEGVENIPARGGALLVVNHGLNGFDTVVLGALLQRDRKRLPYWLGEHNLWRLPGLGRLLDFVDAVPGERGAAVRILQSGVLVVVYPGGVHDSFKLSSERHRLQWGKRAGFARVAMAAGVPIVPLAACGVDDMYTVVARERWLGRTVLGDRRYDWPIAFGRWGTPVPRPARVTIRALPPVETRGDPASEADVERVRAAVFDAVQGALSAAT
jgi:1-acyl-sn-glycerol-3-phosphate acyltransferase